MPLSTRAIRRLLLSLLLVAPVALFAASEERPPNIIFILADDLGYGDLGSFGQTKIRTPHIDRLAREGMKLTHHYAGSPVCAPSRCVLLTGKDPGSAFIRANRGMAKGGIRVVGQPESEGQYPIPDAEITLAEVLQDAGYKTGGFGKWGLGGPDSTGAPLRQGFDRWFGYNCQAVAHNFYPTYLWDDDKTIPLDNPAFPAHDTLRDDEDPNDPASYERFKGNEYSADLISEQALNFIRDNQEQPFFLYWASTVPHVALQVPDDSLEEYVGLWEDPPYPGGKGYIPHFNPRAAYAAMITRMDRDIGRAIDLVEKLGLANDTIFVFTSDNGATSGTHEGLAGTDAAFFNSSGGLRDGKGSIYEGGIRVPAVVTWPGKIPAGSTSDRVTGFEDWLPTLGEVAGANEVPTDISGVSFVPTLQGKKQSARDSLYREFPSYRGQQAIRVGDWKAVRQNLMPPQKTTQIVRTELYHLGTDRAEENNVASEHPELLARLEKMMRESRTPSKDFPFPVLDEATP
ncbi:MAG: arylsulfatase [Opitutaceae bacterium]|jgi:arylsulfatase A|nr:arylsulfatase [Opitutaceae bacterium]